MTLLPEPDDEARGLPVEPLPPPRVPPPTPPPAHDYAYSDADRAEFDRHMQLVRSDPQTEALFHALRLTIKHDLAGPQMAVVGYEAFLRHADEALARAVELMERLTPLIGEVAILKAQMQQSGIDRERIKERLRAAERDIAILKDRTASSNHLSDAPGD